VAKTPAQLSLFLFSLGALAIFPRMVHVRTLAGPGNFDSLICHAGSLDLRLVDARAGRPGAICRRMTITSGLTLIFGHHLVA